MLFLPWGYDIAMVTGILLYLTSSFFGPGLWKIHLPLGLNPGSLLAVSFVFGTFFISLPTSIYNIYMSYTRRTGKMRPFLEAMRPLCSFALAVILCLVWVFHSRNGILESDPRCFFFMSGTLSSNLSCRLIVALLTDTLRELVNVLLYPLAVAVFAAIAMPEVSLQEELVLLYVLTAALTLAHLHFVVCVVIQMCSHLKIKCFQIEDHG